MNTEQYGVLAVMVALAFVLGTVARKARISAAVGYLMAGILVGALIKVPDEVVTALGIVSEISIALLLFEIGFEIHVKKIRQLRGAPTYVTVLELLISIALTSAASLALGIDTNTSAVLGVSAAFASTVFTYKLMEESPPTRDDVRGLVLMTLAAEDIAIVVTLTLLSGGGGGPVRAAEVAVLAVAVAAGVYWAGDLLLPRVIEEGESGLILLISYGLMAALFSSLVGLSPSIGAFVAGVTVSKVPKADEVMKDFRPVRAVFILLFLIFMGVETAATMPNVLRHLPALAIGLLLMPIHLISKAVATLLGGGLGLKYGVEASLYLSTVSELSLIIAYTAASAGVAEAYALPAVAVGVSVASVTASLLTERKRSLVVRVLRLVPRRVRWVIDALSLSVQRQSSSKAHKAVYDLFHTITHSAGEAVIATILAVEALSHVPEAVPAQPILVTAVIITAYLTAAARLVARAVRAADKLAAALGSPRKLRRVAEVASAAIIAGLSAEATAILIVLRYGERVAELLGIEYAALAPALLTAPIAVALLAIAAVAEATKP